MRGRRAPRWGSQRRPFIGPTRCPLQLWFLEWEGDTGVWRRYFADRAEARAALRAHREASPKSRHR